MLAGLKAKAIALGADAVYIGTAAPEGCDQPEGQGPGGSGEIQVLERAARSYSRSRCRDRTRLLSPCRGRKGGAGK